MLNRVAQLEDVEMGSVWAFKTTNELMRVVSVGPFFICFVWVGYESEGYLRIDGFFSSFRRATKLEQYLYGED